MTEDVQSGLSVLLEIGTEEVPSRFLPNAIEDLRSIAARTLEEYRLDHTEITSYATPRRLALMIKEIAGRQKDVVRELFGPAKKAAYDEQGRPTKAALGFAASLGIPVDNLVIRQKGKGDYVAAVVEEKGLATEALLPEILRKIILSLHFPKSMRWGSGSLNFVRPIAWILAVSGVNTIEFEIDGLKSSNQTRGHRFLSPAAYKIIDIPSYKHFLETNYVILDQHKRRDVIMSAMNQLLQNTNMQVLTDEGLLETVTFLVEYPVPVLCSFDNDYLKLPKELLITVMKDHQKYFAVQDGDGSIVNSFIVVSNTKAENTDTVRIGAERVIKARFDDARFYYQEDTSQPLAGRIESLKEVTFHDRLGSLFEKTGRIASVTEYLSGRLFPELTDRAVRAAQLSKADLITGVVREFPELQGIMGKYYARHDGEDSAIADAIEEQYMPKGFGDRLPETDIGTLVSLADKTDNIAAFFSMGLIPTGSEDPFALRRQAMGIVSILLERGYEIGIQEVFTFALGTLNTVSAPEAVMESIRNFLVQRIEFILSSAGHSQEIIKAVLQLSFIHPLKSILQRIHAIGAAQKEEEFPAFLLAAKRVNNIVPGTALPPVQTSLFQQNEEKNLYINLSAAKNTIGAAIAEGNFEAALKVILTMTPSINSFFDHVLVMDKREEVKLNRLTLLRDIWETISPVADFSKFPA